MGVWAVPGFALMSYACTVEPLRAANLLAQRPLYEVVHFGDAASSGSAAVSADLPVGAMASLDLLLVVAGGDPFTGGDEAFDWLRKMDRAGVRIGGVSGGSVLLARAGLMDGRRMTVHWEHGPPLAEQHPDLMIEKRLYVIDRDRVTCGGGTAPLDMMHALIAGDHGHVFARLVMDWFLHTDVRAAAAPQRAGLAERMGVHSPHLVSAIAAMEDHIADPLALDQLALIAGVSGRHLNRLFTDVLGQSAMNYYRNMRLDVGHRMIRGSALPISEIGRATGFATPAHFTNAYTRRYGHSPRSARAA
ncbi:GlxA family transcriptional regulator [Pseudaestuariivita atlantica]|uniref:GlxA family transcriptional regulator n=1 Tax=Pseudaestuariivita atlantica TaxID=1317121 RepID=UPI001F5E9B22|nr:GlxA family transcriptional regulator [Pseudaestuariivita atlantica]